MENTCGQQSSENNNSGRRHPHPSSSRPTGRTSPTVSINGAVLTSRAVLNNCTARTIPTGHTAPAGSITPTGAVVRTGPTVPAGHNLFTGPASLTNMFGGLVMLLQLWSWKRLPMGSLTTGRNMESPQLGGEDLTWRPPLGYGWSSYHQFADHVTCRVMEPYRREINGLIDSEITWLPYEDKMHLLPTNCTEEDRALWRTTAPLIHYWIVEMHNPGRVARQFDHYQNIPPYLREYQRRSS